MRRSRVSQGDVWQRQAPSFVLLVTTDTGGYNDRARSIRIGNCRAARRVEMAASQVGSATSGGVICRQQRLAMSSPSVVSTC